MAIFINENKALLAWLARVEIADLKEPLSVSILTRYYLYSLFGFVNMYLQVPSLTKVMLHPCHSPLRQGKGIEEVLFVVTLEIAFPFMF